MALKKKDFAFFNMLPSLYDRVAMRLKRKSALKIIKHSAAPNYNYFTQTIGGSKAKVPLASSDP